MIDSYFKSWQNQFLHLDTEKILSAPLYNLLEYKDIKLEKLIHRQLYNKFFCTSHQT